MHWKKSPNQCTESKQLTKYGSGPDRLHLPFQVIAQMWLMSMSLPKMISLLICLRGGKPNPVNKWGQVLLLNTQTANALFAKISHWAHAIKDAPIAICQTWAYKAKEGDLYRFEL